MSDSESDELPLELPCERLVRGNIVDTTTWPHIDEGALDNARMDRYLKRKRAVELFLSGASSESIKEETSIGAKQAYTEDVVHR